MDHIYSNIIPELRDKLKKIINLYESEKNKNYKLKSEKEELTMQVEQLQNEQQNLQDKYNNLKLAKTISSGTEDVHGAKLKVNRIVREIDKCIALLNK